MDDLDWDRTWWEFGDCYCGFEHMEVIREFSSIPLDVLRSIVLLSSVVW